MAKLHKRLKIDWENFLVPKHPPKRLNGKEYKKFREEVYREHKGRCSECGEFAPLYAQNGKFNLYSCGHVHHIKSRGAGGSDEVTLETTWLCPECHFNEHGPQWSK